jgi:hypothetical protein
MDLKKLLNGIRVYLKFPSKRSVYAVTGGKYLGEFFVFMEKTDDSVCFLSLPKMKVRKIPIDNFLFGVDNKILDKIEKLPRNIYKTCRSQYIENKNE